MLAYKKPRLDTNTSDSNEDDEDSSVDETVPLCSLIKFPMEFPELESELLTQISEPEPEPEPKPKPKAAKSNSKPKPKQKPKQKSTPKAKPKATPEANPTIDTKPTPVSTIEAGNSEIKEDVSNPAPRPVLSAKQQEKLDADIKSLAQKIVRACTVPDDKKTIRLLRRFWKHIRLEVPKKLPQMCGRNLNFRELLCLVLEHGGWKTVNRKKGGWNLMYQQLAKKNNSSANFNVKASYEKFLLPVERALWCTPLGAREWGMPSWQTPNDPTPACLICGGRETIACLECNRCRARFHHLCYETFYKERVSGPQRALGPDSSIWVCRHCARWSAVTRCRRTEIDPVTGLSVVFAREDALNRSKLLP